MTMKNITMDVLFLISILLATVIFDVESAPTCGNQIHITPNYCKYGLVKDWCHRDVCAKAPGERCGGPWGRMGKCAAGTYCACGRCTGCATLTLQCYHGEFC